MTARRLAALGAALAAVAIATGYAGPGPSTPPSVPVSTPAVAAVPSTAELDALLAHALSPTPEQRRGAIEGDGTEYELIDRHPKAPVFVHTVVAVRPENASRVWAQVQTTVDGAALPDLGEVPFVLEGASWKVRRALMCTMMTTQDRPSPHC
ncbi:hypothetical protein [Nocardia asteroides]|uniref:hypothetical protein n=1 Tax=Nocardia asteroides TaxID=1824 RepID=UPI001E56751A|nr:hypothetical protein [Nocardia asteroides]UGT61812.1 hypothetical protein LTT61_00180 [Nocardia asteroides]